MKIPPFLLGNWMSSYESATPPIRFNLAGSTGPRWTFGELLDLGGNALLTEIEAMSVSYTPARGTVRLRQQIARLHGVDPDCVVVTSGASEALLMLMCVIGESGVNVALPAPGYPATEAMAQAWGVQIRHYPLYAREQFKQRSDGVLRAVDANTRLAMVNTPHNPTGSVMPAEEIRKLALALHERSIPLAVDEVFHRLYFADEQPTAATLPNTLVIGDMSKSLSLAGLRIGWLIDADAQRRSQLIESRSCFAVSSSPLMEALAAVALEASDVILERLKKTAGANLAALERFIEQNGSAVRWVKPAGGTLAFLWRVDGQDSRPLCEAWARAGVLVAPGDCFGMPSHVRVGFGYAEPGDFDEALDLMAQVLTRTP